mmetsp:Transcript_20738/g.49179  ORF Transcript_20738/g.49179 Transcript_20738/m.49179 type:complete len:268 (+) Transcript_20738:1964-2767(+)
MDCPEDVQRPSAQPRDGAEGSGRRQRHDPGRGLAVQALPRAAGRGRAEPREAPAPRGGPRRLLIAGGRLLAAQPASHQPEGRERLLLGSAIREHIVEDDVPGPLFQDANVEGADHGLLRKLDVDDRAVGLLFIPHTKAHLEGALAANHRAHRHEGRALPGEELQSRLRALELAHGAHHVADVLEEVGAAGLHVGSELHHQEIRDRVLLHVHHSDLEDGGLPRPAALHVPQEAPVTGQVFGHHDGRRPRRRRSRRAAGNLQHHLLPGL